MDENSHQRSDGGNLESTAALLKRVRDGDAAARDRLIERYLPALRRWARGRLPARARSLADTDDLVQVTLLRALNRVKDFESRHQGAFLAYLRRALLNQIRDEIRRAAREPAMQALPPNILHNAPSPLQHAIGREELQAYEESLERLAPEQQEAVILRLELGLTHAEVAEALGSPSPNAARMLVARAVVRLAEVMHAR